MAILWVACWEVELIPINTGMVQSTKGGWRGQGGCSRPISSFIHRGPDALPSTRNLRDKVDALLNDSTQAVSDLGLQVSINVEYDRDQENIIMGMAVNGNFVLWIIFCHEY